MVAKAAPVDRLNIFLEAAKQQGNQAAQDLISNSASSFLVADYSYFREAAGMKKDDPIINKHYGGLPKPTQLPHQALPQMPGRTNNSYIHHLFYSTVM